MAAAAATARSEVRRSSAPDAGGLFAEYSADIFAYCLHNLGSRSDAEDALQTTFLHAHRALQSGVKPECEPAWLMAIAKNACRWQRRTRSRRSALDDGSIDVTMLPAPSDEERQGAVADLKDALASIPERQRQALVLRELQGLQPSEIAPRLGATMSETYALLSRARRSVASALTVAARRPVLGIDVGSLLLQLRSSLAGSPAAVGATAVAIAGVGVAGLTVERAVTHHPAKVAPAVVRNSAASTAPAARVGRVTQPSRHRPARELAPARARHRQRVPLSAQASGPRENDAPAPRGSGSSASSATSVPAAPVVSSAPSTHGQSSSTPGTTPAQSPAPPSPPAVPPIPDPGLPPPLPDDPTAPVSTVVTTVISLLPSADPTDPPPAPAPTPPPVPQVTDTVGGLLP